MSRLIFMVFVADLIACRLQLPRTLWHVDQHVTPRLWSRFRVWLL
jgi:hypothetical protein